MTFRKKTLARRSHECRVCGRAKNQSSETMFKAHMFITQHFPSMERRNLQLRLQRILPDQFYVIFVSDIWTLNVHDFFLPSLFFASLLLVNSSAGSSTSVQGTVNKKFFESTPQTLNFDMGSSNQENAHTMDEAGMCKVVSIPLRLWITISCPKWQMFQIAEFSRTEEHVDDPSEIYEHDGKKHFRTLHCISSWFCILSIWSFHFCRFFGWYRNLV